MSAYKLEGDPIPDASVVVVGQQYRFTVLTDRLVRYEWSPDGKFEDRASTFAINRKLPVPEFRVLEAEQELEIITPYFHLIYDKKGFSPNGLTVTFRSKVTLWGNGWRYGTTESNLGGTARTLDEIDGRCSTGFGVLSKTGIAAIDDSNSMLFDGNGFVAGRHAGDRVDGYLFCYGHDYKAAIRALYNLSGKQPRLPRWALGNWWSRYYPYSDIEYLQLMDKFSDAGIPLTVAVLDMDWHLVDDERVPHSGWTGYTWNEKLFPNPAGFGRALHNRKLKITLNDHPHGGVHHHEDSYEAMAKALRHDTTHKAPILFDATNKAFLDAFFNILHRRIEEASCDFWWVDWQQGPYSKVDGVDPLWLLNHFHFLDNAQIAKDPLILSRYAGPGSHRYPVGFSGDTITTWNSLEFQPEFTATASNIGYGWWSHDIGGHFHGYRDDELVARWVQFGVFSPIMRLHSSNSLWSSKEPWKYPRECQDVMVHYLRLRHRLIPYIYTMNVLAHEQDEPLIQPMYWLHPARSEAYEVPNQYYFGRYLIVAPVVTPRSSRTGLAGTKAWVPPGRHIDIITGITYDGDREIYLYRRLHEYPLLASKGSIIPLDASQKPLNGALNPQQLEIIVIVGANGSFEITEDRRDDYDHPECNGTSGVATYDRKLAFVWTQETGKLTASVSSKTAIRFRFIGLTHHPGTLKVTLNGNPTTDFISRLYQYPEVPSLDFAVDELLPGENIITLQLDPDPQLGVIDHTERLKDLLLSYQSDFDQKEVIWDIVTQKKSPNVVRIGRLMALRLDEDLIGPLVELILADSRTC
ncbi:Alpha-xylosidase [Dactylellina cionopaga]|nr:Alpha-xylosidase [Dactylellina cionopaga]